jgi:hypothetical protein
MIDGPLRRGGGDMKRLLIGFAAMTLASALVGAAYGARPFHDRYSFSDSFVSPAGDRCDFDYRISFTLTANDIVFGDPDNPDRVISHTTAFVSHTNLETGYTLTEVDNGVQILDFEKGVGMSVGIIWKLRTPEGKLVFVQVGRATYTFEDELLTITPHLLPVDASPIVCGLLGGNAA